MGGPILGQAALGNVESRDNLDARDEGLGWDVNGRRYRAQQSIDPHPQDEARAKGFNVNICRTKFKGSLQQVVDGADDRCTTREISQALDIVVAMRNRRL